MMIIKGFGKAKPLLTREGFFELHTPPLQSKDTARKKEPSTEQIVKRIITEVRNKGDKALFHYTKKLDKVELDSLEVTRSEISAAYEKTDKKLLSALKLAANRVYEFHSCCNQKIETGFLSNGVGRQIRPLHRVGIYVPGGTAAYPSTVLMTALPARAAGVEEIVMVTPSQRDGTVPTPTLVAADLARVNRLFKLGGAQAIAALAYGTESIPKVDKICGPGNIFVATAKKLVYGMVDIDGIQGPSEVIIIADDTANASFCAADLIAQAEHDPMASAILITTSAAIASNVENEIRVQLTQSKRENIATAAINSRGMIVLIDNLDEAIELVNLYAPEHLMLMVHDAGIYIEKIHNSGCIFINESSPVVLGDYTAGPSHVLPTGGTARFSSPLGVEDFLKVINIVAIDEDTQKKLGQAAIDMAEAEGLQGHAQAIKIRLQSTNGITK